MKDLKNIILLTLGVLLMIVILQNTATVSFHVLLWKVSMPLIIMTAVSLFAGFAAGRLTRRKRG
ncbi:MAG TPA: LapA family protein [Pontiellaceae bacterium]|nr:LapA family protein [Pontiellaceae bacterium]HPR82262.1 LapA family protein [Pontiellaceae bacterium]